MTRPRVVALVGPTAAGKTSLALELAEWLGAEIVSADSRQIYRGLDVGTAKPSAAERVRVPHHCLDVVGPEETYDAARFRDTAATAIEAIHGRGKHVLVVGGTGLYVRALLRGLCAAPPRVHALRRLLEGVAATEGPAVLHRRLAHVDPVAAARIHPHDAVRAVRALEVALSTGRRLSAWQEAHGFSERPYDTFTIGLDRPAGELETRIVARTRAMVAAGLLEEVRGLVRCIAADAPAWRTVGYREMRACVEGVVDLPAAVAAIVRATRRFAKRQRTWFRADPGLVWRDPERERSQIHEEVRSFLAPGQIAKPQGAR